MFAQTDRRHGCEGVVVIRGGHNHRVDVTMDRVQHLAVILELFRGGKRLESAARMPPVHITQCDDVLALQLINVAGRLAARTNGRDVQLFIRGVGAGRTGAQDGESGGGMQG